MKKPIIHSPLFLIAIFVLLLQGCGESGAENASGGSSLIGAITPVNEIAAGEQYYLSALVPLNSKHTVSKEQRGNAVVKLTGDTVTVNLKANGLDPNTNHRASIHKGEFCPGDEADLNQDGAIDQEESHAYHGALLISLGADIGNRDRSLASDEVASDRIGMLEYLSSVSYQALSLDIQTRSADLVANAAFNFDGTIVMVYGVQGSTALPSSVSTNRDLSPQESLPVLCGKLRAYN